MQAGRVWRDSKQALKEDIYAGKCTSGYNGKNNH